MLCLGGVRIDALLESELEARFVEALRRVELDGDGDRDGAGGAGGAGGVGSTAGIGGTGGAVRMRADLVRGKPGYVLTVGGQTYYVEPQAEIGPSEGVAEPSRPPRRKERPLPGVRSRGRRLSAPKPRPGSRRCPARTGKKPSGWPPPSCAPCWRRCSSAGCPCRKSDSSSPETGER